MKMLILSCGRANLGRARVIPGQEENGVYVHRTVKLRMDHYVDPSGKKYKPRAHFRVVPTFVD
jgi:hypothetical protein